MIIWTDLVINGLIGYLDLSREHWIEGIIWNDLVRNGLKELICLIS